MNKGRELKRVPIVSSFYMRTVHYGGNLTVAIPRALLRELHVTRGELVRITRIPGRAWVCQLVEDSVDGKVRRAGNPGDGDQGTAAPAPAEH